ncbi:phage tail protein I [Croceicoccus estronivorus]|uniref:phage tail protein I n=1 Tax=Croceicoccus estronivorus TaxID=1172626 RepID=UPI000834ECDA|nr:phage tail protein I [Croceicoccus estronivorus]OCC25310.1 phage tail protein I [Croceicoccus estronivorus]
MAEAASLLPPNTTPFERALEQALAARQGLPADLVGAVLDADRCPARLLDFLAWDLSVDLWQDDWPELKKRHVLRNAWQLHRIKTTLAGIKAHVALVDAQVVKVTRPPARGFLRGAMTEQQRIDWLNSLPQVRIYPFIQRGTARPRHGFYSGPAGLRFHATGAARPFLLASNGPRLTGRCATWFDRGQEVPVTLADPLGGLAERIFIGRTGARRAFHGSGFYGRGYLTASTAEQRVVTVRPAAEDTGEIFAVPSGTRTVDVRPQRIARQRIAPRARSFFHRNALGRRQGFLCASHAPYLIYDRYCLVDRERMGTRQRALSWHSHGRFGIAPFTAELRIAIPMHRPRARSGRWHGNGFRRSASMAPLARAIEAVRVSKAHRDTIYIDTTTMIRAQFGSGLRFGDFTFGEIRKAA